MNKIMNPSQKPITGGQIGKVNDLLAAKLRKHEKQLPSDQIQLILETRGDLLAAELLQVVYCYLEDNLRGMPSFRTSRNINYERSIVEALKATGIHLCMRPGMIITETTGRNLKEIEIFFFQIDHALKNNDELEQEFEKRLLIPVDPRTAVAVMEWQEQDFLRKYPFATIWKDNESRWSFLSLIKKYDTLNLIVDSDDDGWETDKWFIGVSKNLGK